MACGYTVTVGLRYFLVYDTYVLRFICFVCFFILFCTVLLHIKTVINRLIDRLTMKRMVSGVKT